MLVSCVHKLTLKGDVLWRNRVRVSDRQEEGDEEMPQHGNKGTKLASACASTSSICTCLGSGLANESI